MRVGALRLELEISGALSLKEKRSVLRSLKERIGNNFNVSVAEVDNHDKWQRATIGIACVSNDKPHVESALHKIVDMVEGSKGVVLLDFQLEVL